jgi:Ser/Thr protein kinase RdoA (MazF antagonist)
LKNPPIWMESLPPIDSICRHFGLGEYTGRWEKLGGSFNVNVKVDTVQGSYVLRLLNDAVPAERLMYLQRTLSGLANRGVPAPIPLLSIAEGEPFMKTDDGALLQALPYVDAEGFGCRRSEVFSSAKMLRSYHAALENAPEGPPPITTFFPDDDYFIESLDVLKSVEGISKFGLAEAQEAAGRINEAWAKLAPKVPHTLIHGDWHFWNQLYHDGEVRCVLDFDFMRQGERILDVAYALWAIYILLPNQTDRFLPVFLQGYGELTEAEQELLPFAIARTALFFLSRSAASANPADKWDRQYAKQMPLIRHLLAQTE